MKSRLSADLFACGPSGLPDTLEHGACTYRLSRCFKHDFFAATGLYEREDADSSVPGSSVRKAILKINRKQPFCGVPLAWLGKGLRNHEVKILRSLQGIEQVPRLLGEHGKCGFLYEYIEGCSLDESPHIPDTFFDGLKDLLDRVHGRNICYLDMNKRGNILIGADGKPHLIDFQISLCLGRPWRRLLAALQREDIYHLYKHKRKFRSDLLTPEEEELSRRRSGLIRIHRCIATPLRRLRRWFLGRLVRRRILQSPDGMECSPENDLRRYDRSREG